MHSLSLWPRFLLCVFRNITFLCGIIVTSHVNAHEHVQFSKCGTWWNNSHYRHAFICNCQLLYCFCVYKAYTIIDDPYTYTVGYNKPTEMSLYYVYPKVTLGWHPSIIVWKHIPLQSCLLLLSKLLILKHLCNPGQSKFLCNSFPHPRIISVPAHNFVCTTVHILQAQRAFTIVSQWADCWQCTGTPKNLIMHVCDMDWKTHLWNMTQL